MSGIVVEDQMDGQPSRCAALDALQKAQELFLAMTRHAARQHSPDRLISLSGREPNPFL